MGIIKESMISVPETTEMKRAIGENLRKAIDQYIQTHRDTPPLVIKKWIYDQATAHGLLPQDLSTRTLIKKVLIDYLVGDRRLKIANIREALLKYRSTEQLISLALRKYGRGTIGSKALGIEASFAILSDSTVRAKYGFTLPVYKPRSYYLGSNLLLEFIHYNEPTLGKYRKLKYESFEKVQEVQEELEHEFMRAKMPGYIMRYLEFIVKEIHRPIIVRSSSKLEDNPDASFAGKYASYFLANEGSLDDRLAALEHAIKKTWRSVFNPDAIIYRQKMGFLRRDEQMAVLLQKVIGRKFEVVYTDRTTGKTKKRRLFAPIIAGVGFSRNLIYVLSPRIKQEDGMVRLVIGLGTRAVERNRAYEASLSLPGFFPEQHPHRKQKMTQSTMDCLDLERNEVVHLPVSWAARYSGKFYDLVNPYLSVIRDGYEQPLLNQLEIEFQGTPEKRAGDNIIIDFHRLLQGQNYWQGYCYPEEMRRIWRALEENLGYPLDIEFCFNKNEQGQFHFFILQARPQIYSEGMQPVKIPRYRQRDLIIENNQCLTTGKTREGSEYLIYVDSLEYKNFPDKLSIARAIGKIVHHPRVEPKGSIAIMPGRTGSNNPELGVPVHFSEISELRGLVEYGDEVLTTDISYGTHFYSEIRDVNIQYMPVQKNDARTIFNDALMKNAPSITRELLPGAGVEAVIRVIHLTAAFPSKKAYLFLNGMEKRGILVLRS